MIAWPGVMPGTSDALTTSVDIYATLVELFGASVTHRTHGKSLVPLLNDHSPFEREHVLAGVWGREVHLIDKGWKYARAPLGENEPLSMWSNRWSTMPIANPKVRLPLPDDRAVLDRMPGSKVPVIRQPFRAGDMLPYWATGKFSGNHLYNLRDDPAEDENRAGETHELDAADQLREALKAIEAPDDQFARLGLS